MIPLYLFVQDFLCYETAEIDFSLFNSAIVIGAQNHNSLVANAVGKTSLFRSIEFVLFNRVRDPVIQKDIVLDELIRNKTDRTKIIFDFTINEDIYRVIRIRTKKGISDLSLYKRNAVESNISIHTSDTPKNLWDNLSSRRTTDTEADLAKLIKSNYKTFLSTTYFMQNDLFGLAATTPEKRKGILKEVFGLMVYAKLEEAAKEKAANILKTIDTAKTLLIPLGSPQQDIISFSKEEINVEEKREIKAAKLLLQKQTLIALNEQYSNLLSQVNVLSSQSASVLAKHSTISNDINRLEASLQEWTSKYKNIIINAKKVIAEMEDLKKTKETLGKIEEQEIIIAQSKSASLNQDLNLFRVAIATLDITIAESSIPLPADGTCKHCRQILTPEHRKACLEKEAEKLISSQKEKQVYLNNIHSTSQLIKEQEQLLSSLSNKKRQIEITAASLINKEKEIQDQKKTHSEYGGLIEKFQKELSDKKADLLIVNKEVQSSSIKETDELKKNLIQLKNQIDKETMTEKQLSQEISTLQSQLAVIKHSINQRKIDIEKQSEFKKTIIEAELEYTIYPSIIQAFGSSGISNLVIQNLLEDLQIEANNLLSQIKPGLQLEFSIEKERNDGSTAETLEINYFINNEPRSFSTISGAQRLSVAFALKLGLSFLLGKMMGTQIKFLLLDEVDASLDKASIDSLADIVKHFSQDFKILVISHNDRLIEKFGTQILVEQNQDMVSKAKVLSF